MKTYYIQQDNQQQGPYSIDQLKNMQINPAVPVREEGFKNWLKAKEIPELYKALFAGSPQVVLAHAKTKKEPLQPGIEKTGPAVSRKRTTALVVLALFITGFLIVKLQQSESHVSASASVSAIEQKNASVKTPAQLKEERRKKEIASPAAYIKTKINWRKNLVGETVLEGTLTNMATWANFKDPVVSVTWLSKTNTALATSRYPVYEYLGAKKTISYKLKVKAPAKYNSVKASVESATAL
ncbi:MAG TPA: DUF4339 domain-containing protein [Chitinophagaceae bacterium]|nr:DUF4339 domain-containing protein [Chitinophagaceae bacterium]